MASREERIAGIAGMLRFETYSVVPGAHGSSHAPTYEPLPAQHLQGIIDASIAVTRDPAYQALQARLREESNAPITFPLPRNAPNPMTAYNQIRNEERGIIENHLVGNNVPTTYAQSIDKILNLSQEDGILGRLTRENEGFHSTDMSRGAGGFSSNLGPGEGSRGQGR